MTRVVPLLAAPAPVRRRLVLHVPGYEPLSPSEQRQRLLRTLDRTSASWRLVFSSSIDAGEDGFRASLSGPNWTTEAEIRILAWDDLIARDLAVPLPRRVLSGAAALAALLWNGTLRRYRDAHWRYLLFVALPVAIVLAAIFAGVMVAAALGGGAGILAGLLASLFLIVLADRRLHLGHLFADWTFARSLASGDRPELTARIERFAEEITAARRRQDVEEVVLIGHSLGMVLLAEALALSLTRDTEIASPRLALVGLGSSVLKIALMPDGSRLRAALRRIGAAPQIAWMEYTSRRDLVSFHRADPMAMLDLGAHGPRVECIHPRDMLQPKAWRRVRRSMLRAHRIYVTGNGRRYFYDWGLIACGPGAVGRSAFPDQLISPDGCIGVPPMVRAA